MQKAKRVLSIITVLAMLLGVMSVSVFAEGDTPPGETEPAAAATTEPAAAATTEPAAAATTEPAAAATTEPAAAATTEPAAAATTEPAAAATTEPAAAATTEPAAAATTEPAAAATTKPATTSPATAGAGESTPNDAQNEDEDEEDSAASLMASLPIAEITVNGVTTQYDTLQDAFNAVPNDGTATTITLLRDVEDGGVALYNTKDSAHPATQKNIVLDFDGHTYTIGNPLVGSTGYESQAFHLEKGNTVTMMNGTIDSEKALMLVQNYCNLTLEDMTLDGSSLKGKGSGVYTLSNNFGSVTIKGDTDIIAKKDAEGNVIGFAFDLWYGMAKDGTYDEGITVKFDDSFSGTVEGNIEYGASGRAAKDWREKTILTINGSGTFNGTISASSKDALDNASISVSGGTFSTDIEKYVADTYKAYQTVGDDSTVTVAPTAGYTIIFCDDNGNVVDTQTLEYGQTPTAPAQSKASDSSYYYSFAGYGTTVDPVTGNAKYTAVFVAIPFSDDDDDDDDYVPPVAEQPQEEPITLVDNGVPLAGLPDDFTETFTPEAAADYAADLGIVDSADSYDATAEVAGSSVVDALNAIAAPDSTDETSVNIGAIAESVGIDLESSVTREQMVTVLFTLAEAQGFDVSARAELAQFADAENVSEFAQEAIEWAVSIGLLKGFDEETLAPDGIMTQEQMLLILMRYMELTK